MMNSENANLGRASAAFAVSASVTVIFNTALACIKDAYQPLNHVMNSIAWHNWITQGFADVILFFGLGLMLSKADLAGRIPPNRLISCLVAGVIISGAGLLVWYATAG